MNSDIRGKIESDDVTLGEGVVIEEGVVIRANKVVIGDYAYIGANTKVFVPEFKLGEYTRLNADSFAGGKLPLQIGRHCYIGAKVRLDSHGGLDIDDNVGIGDHSQIWTHIKHGDTTRGCRFATEKYMHIGKDAWFVGHSLVSPVYVGEKSMALLGSVITRDMMPNHTYAGVPAVDVTAKVGPQFEALSIEQKAALLKLEIQKFELRYPQFADALKVAGEYESGVTCFDVVNETYTKTRSAAEIAFFKSTSVKYVPHGEGAFVVPQYPPLVVAEVS
jgi:acetyltransferase-like isoleucine patch superfamily enzyme